MDFQLANREGLPLAYIIELPDGLELWRDCGPSENKARIGRFNSTSDWPFSAFTLSMKQYIQAQERKSIKDIISQQALIKLGE